MRSFQGSYYLKNKMPPTILQQAQDLEMRIANLKRKLPKPTQKELIESHLSMEGYTSQVKQKIEIRNTRTFFRQLKQFNPLSIRDFKHAHYLLTQDLGDENGSWREGEVVVLEGKKVAFVPPKARFISKYMQEVFQYIKSNAKQSWLIKACVFHYGIEFIHPFFDGNGRMGRIWQHLLLAKASPVFNSILMSDLIRKNEFAYYRILDKSDRERDVTIFIAFCFQKIMKEIKKLEKLK